MRFKCFLKSLAQTNAELPFAHIFICIFCSHCRIKIVKNKPPEILFISYFNFSVDGGGAGGGGGGGCAEATIPSPPPSGPSPG